LASLNGPEETGSAVSDSFWALSRDERPSGSLANHPRGQAPQEKGKLNMNIAIIPQSWTPALQAILRVMTALLFLEHGTGKILGFPALPAMPMPSAMLVGTGLIELIGGVLILVGFLTRPTAFILSGYMAVAYFMAHAPQGFFPVLNQGELAILFCFVFLYFAAAGAGPYAIDKA
jgi:putative oxidoreductase